MVSWIFAAVLAASGVLAAPPTVTPRPRVDEAVAKRAGSCTFSGSAGAASASASKASCATIVLSSVAVPSGTTLDLTGLNDGTQVIFEGTTTFGYKEWEGPLVAVSGKQVTVTGASGSSLDGSGAKWWDGQGSNGGKTKPKFFQAHDLTDSTISGVNIVNAPVQVFSINSVQGLNVTGVTINNSDGDSQGGHNTDCFDIGSSDSVTITNAKCYNQDDCVAVNSGTNILFTGGYCSGGHGLSIGSVGGRSDNTVDTVRFESSHIVNSENGVRVKTISGKTGTVNAVTYKDITLSGITKYGVLVEQAYNGKVGSPTNGVKVSALTLDGVTGSVSSSATDVFIDCGDGSCTDWTWTGVSVTGGKTSSSCLNVPSGASC
ncbi:putative extracellular polygalacturonase [Thozetella sp. PMI_491]|nr:putative extracellular polygalacturonase [Thozetella sp. PMI_491]